MKNDNPTIYLTSPIGILLFLIFFFAKIFDKIDWSWWWVFSPLWIPFAFFLGILIIVGLVYLGILIIETILTWKL